MDNDIVNLDIETERDKNNQDGGFLPLVPLVAIGAAGAVGLTGLVVVPAAANALGVDPVKISKDLSDKLPGFDVIDDLVSNMSQVMFKEMPELFEKIFEDTPFLEPIKLGIDLFYQTIAAGASSLKIVDVVVDANGKRVLVPNENNLAFTIILELIHGIFPFTKNKSLNEVFELFNQNNIGDTIPKMAGSMLVHLCKVFDNISAVWDQLPVPITAFINSIIASAPIPSQQNGGTNLTINSLNDVSNLNYVDLDKVRKQYEQLPKDARMGLFGEKLDFDNLDTDRVLHVYNNLPKAMKVFDDDPQKHLINQMGGETVCLIVVICIIVVVAIVAVVVIVVVVVIALLCLLCVAIIAIVLIVFLVISALAVAVIALVALVGLVILGVVLIQQGPILIAAYRGDNTKLNELANNYMTKFPFEAQLGTVNNYSNNSVRMVEKLQEGTEIATTAVASVQYLGTEGSEKITETGVTGIGAVGTIAESGVSGVVGVGSLGSMGSTGSLEEIVQQTGGDGESKQKLNLNDNIELRNFCQLLNTVKNVNAADFTPDKFKEALGVLKNNPESSSGPLLIFRAFNIVAYFIFRNLPELIAPLLRGEIPIFSKDELARMNKKLYTPVEPSSFNINTVVTETHQLASLQEAQISANPVGKIEEEKAKQIAQLAQQNVAQGQQGQQGQQGGSKKKNKRYRLA